MKKSKEVIQIYLTFYHIWKKKSLLYCFLYHLKKQLIYLILSVFCSPIWLLNQSHKFFQFFFGWQSLCDCAWIILVLDLDWYSLRIHAEWALLPGSRTFYFVLHYLIFDCSWQPLGRCSQIQMLSSGDVRCLVSATSWIFIFKPMLRMSSIDARFW